MLNQLGKPRTEVPTLGRAMRGIPAEAGVMFLGTLAHA